MQRSCNEPEVCELSLHQSTEAAALSRHSDVGVMLLKDLSRK